MSKINHAVQVAFYINGPELSEQLASFCSIKKLGWSPDVKIAMAKMPVSNIEDAAWALLRNQQTSVLQGILHALLKPINEHDLFDLSDWLRDLQGVPDYLKDYWSTARIPSLLDELVHKALTGKDMVLIMVQPTKESKKWGFNESYQADEKQVKTAPIPRATKASKSKTLKGSKGRGKVSKQDVKYMKPEPKSDEVTDVDVKVVIGDAVAALNDKKMLALASKTVWTRVNKAVGILLREVGMDFTKTRPVRVATEDPKQSMVTYYIGSTSEKWEDDDWGDFKANFLTAFDGHVADIEPVDDEEPPRSFKVWFIHA